MNESEMVRRCTSWLGHKFEARYSSAGPKEDIMTVMAALDNNTIYAGKMVLDALTTKTYVCDVCVRCGHTLTPNKEKA